MIAVLGAPSTEQQLRAEIISGEQRQVVAVLGQVLPELRDDLMTIEGVDAVSRVSRRR